MDARSQLEVTRNSREMDATCQQEGIADPRSGRGASWEQARGEGAFALESAAAASRKRPTATYFKRHCATHLQ